MVELSRQPEIGRAFWYLGVTTTIPLMAFAGYMIGRQYNKEVLGALAGTLLGTILVWLDMLKLGGIIGRGKKRGK
jgi:hypothetical protein